MPPCGPSTALGGTAGPAAPSSASRRFVLTLFPLSYTDCVSPAGLHFGLLCAAASGSQGPFSFLFCWVKVCCHAGAAMGTEAWEGLLLVVKCA